MTEEGCHGSSRFVFVVETGETFTVDFDVDLMSNLIGGQILHLHECKLSFQSIILFIYTKIDV